MNSAEPLTAEAPEKEVTDVLASAGVDMSALVDVLDSRFVGSEGLVKVVPVMLEVMVGTLLVR